MTPYGGDGQESRDEAEGLPYAYGVFVKLTPETKRQDSNLHSLASKASDQNPLAHLLAALLECSANTLHGKLPVFFGSS